MDRDMLIQYVDILNKMEDTPYDVRMTHNDLDDSIIHFVEGMAEDNTELKELLKLLKSLSSEKRTTYIKKYFNQKDNELDSTAVIEEKKVSLGKAKEMIKKNYSGDFGFTNNAVYYFLIMLGVLFFLFLLLFIFVL